MQLVLLADRPEAVAKLARWYFDEWAHEVPGMTVEKVAARVATCTSRLGPPMLILAEEAGEVVGAAELKIREMDIYPQYEHWMGGVYVAASQRGKGVGARLVVEVMARARAAGIETLYLQTEDLGGGLYGRHGFEPIEEVDYKGHRVLVMQARIGA